MAPSGAIGIPANGSQCFCFSTCTLEDANAFLNLLPTWIEDSSSPWLPYLRAVYGDVPLPFDFSRLHFFYHNDDLWRKKFSVEWPMAPCPVNMKRFTFSHSFDITKNESYAYNRCSEEVCRRWRPSAARKHGRPQAASEVLHFSGETRGISTASMLYSRFGGTFSLGRSTFPSNSWMEVIRSPTPASRPEGTANYGCWFFPAAGSGIWLNTGKTLHSTVKPISPGEPPPHGDDHEMLFRVFARRQKTPLSAGQLKKWQANATTTVAPDEWSRRGHHLETYPLIAKQLGFETFQEVSAFFNEQTGAYRGVSELIVLSSECMLGAQPIGTCPTKSVPLRSGWEATSHCQCQENGRNGGRSQLLNCAE